ncbi:glycoside hydrolase clan GH-D [Actinobacteria bacterium OK006]|nr:glycoside hydrolase clan GH-D [Actinobacteria bacterium OK006]
MTFQGEGLLALDPGDGSPVRLWAAADPLHAVPSIRLTVREGRAEVSADGPVAEHRHRPGPDGIQGALAAWADGLGLPAPRPAPTVWCSRYEHFNAVTEDDIRENLTAMDGLALPVEVVQIDDGHQGALDDWLTLSGRLTSRAGLAETISARGRRAGIWTAPFLVDPRSELAAVHPDWLVRTSDGSPLRAGRNRGHDLYVLDTTHLAAAAYLIEAFAVLRIEGYDYFKVDFLHAGALDGVRRSGADALTAYREGIALIREAIGPDAYLLACRAPILPSIGLFDALRVSPDTAPHRHSEAEDFGQPGLGSAEFTGRGRQWQHGRLWVNDPGRLIAGHPVESRERWAAYLETTGGLMASSDRLLSLDDWGVTTTRRLLGASSLSATSPIGADHQ